MKKTMLVITGLVCVALLGACGNQKSASGTKSGHGQFTNKTTATKLNQLLILNQKELTGKLINCQISKERKFISNLGYLGVLSAYLH